MQPIKSCNAQVPFGNATGLTASYVARQSLIESKNISNKTRSKQDYAKNGRHILTCAKS